MLKRALLVSFVIASITLLAPHQTAADPLIFVDPADYIPPPPYSPGTTFVVPVEISGAMDLTSWQFDLTYNPTDVKIVTSCDPFTDPYCNFDGFGVTEGPFFGSLSPFNVFNPGFVLLNAGLQSGNLIAVNDTFGGDTPPSGGGILAYIEFVDLTENGTGESIAVTNASTESAAPEPATLALLVSGLVLLSGRRLIRGKQRK